MKAAALQVLGLIGITVGGGLVADAGGVIVGLGVSAVYVGLAMEKN